MKVQKDGWLLYLEERELYATQLKDIEVEARLPMMDLYGFCIAFFTKKDSELIKQWKERCLRL
ncbi:hypothetical protein KHA80_00125 [Anaerobacillus sp. HL2]|nr:hypothetical protein KHA80_00125 [Anaerobacillus sp. HL2]